MKQSDKLKEFKFGFEFVEGSFVEGIHYKEKIKIDEKMRRLYIKTVPKKISEKMKLFEGEDTPDSRLKISNKVMTTPRKTLLMKKSLTPKLKSQRNLKPKKISALIKSYEHFQNGVIGSYQAKQSCRKGSPGEKGSSIIIYSNNTLTAGTICDGPTGGGQSQKILRRANKEDRIQISPGEYQSEGNTRILGGLE